MNRFYPKGHIKPTFGKKKKVSNYTIKETAFVKSDCNILETQTKNYNNKDAYPISMTSQKLSKQAENISREVLDIMTKRHYSSISAMDLMRSLIKKYNETDTCQALAFLCAGKLIRLNDSMGKSSYLKYFELLDENGEPIKNTMIGVYHDDLSFGIVYYDPRSIFNKSTYCHDHLDQQVEQTKSIIDPECEKCFKERAERICLEHNQSLEFCQLCKIRACENLEAGKIEGFDQVWQRIKNKHHAGYWAN